MAQEPRERSNGAEHRDTVSGVLLRTLFGTLFRTVVFAVASLAAWWCCSSVASADDATSGEPPADAADVPGALEVNVLASALGLLPQPAPAPEAPPAVEPPPALRTTDDEAVDAAPVEPVLVPGVVLPLLAAVEPVLGPANEVVEPVLAAVTTPLAPVVPVVDAVAAPLLAPVAVPLVAAVSPLVEGTGTAVAPVVGLVATPVVALVAPALAPLTKPVVAPFAAGTRVADVRPSTQDAPAGLHPAAVDVAPTEIVVETAAAPTAPASRVVRSARASTADHDDDVISVGETAAVAAPLAPPRPAGAPFRPAAPATSAVVMAHGGPDAGQRDQRFVAVLSPAADVPGARLSALSRTPVVSPLARFGGRPPVTPD